MNGRIDIKTQEVGTGNSIVICQMFPNSPVQRERAADMVRSLHALGLYAVEEEVTE